MLKKNSANFEPLSPVSFLRRAAQVAPNKTAIIHGRRQYTYQEFWDRSCRLASALQSKGVSIGDCVAIMGANTPEMLEAHNAVPMIGAVLNSLNIRLDAHTIGFILGHGEAKVLLTDSAFSSTIKKALSFLENPPLVIDIDDPESIGGELLGVSTYEDFIASSSQDYIENQLEDEWQALSLLYTSGTTGNPKGCVYHHRGAYLNALGNVLTMKLDDNSVYLWTLPMFHCDGWTFTWAVTAAIGTHVCLRDVDPKLVYELIENYRVTHMCGAPIVLNMLANAPPNIKRAFEHKIKIATGGAAPPSSVIEAMEAGGFEVTHLYGLTETYGPATICLPQEDWHQLSLQERSSRIARQGVHYSTLENATVKNPETMKDTPWDGKTYGELMIKGNTIMKGYLKNPQATDQTFKDGWLHTGDIAVRHADGYIEVKDRSKDIIISGGENISSLEVEEALYRHPKILEAAVVAMPDEKWGETPCAFVTIHNDQAADSNEIIDFCRNNLAGYKVPKTVIFGDLPKTSTGKIQKFILRDEAQKIK